MTAEGLISLGTSQTPITALLTGSGCHLLEWSGVEWSGVEWSGVEWSGVEWSGVEWSGVEWYGILSRWRCHAQRRMLQTV